YTLKQWEPEPLMVIDYRQQNGSNRLDEGGSENVFVPYLGIWGFFTLLLCIITSDWIVKERNLLFERIMTTYKGLRVYLLQTVTMFFLFQCSQTLLSYVVFVYFGWINHSFLMFGRMVL